MRLFKVCLFIMGLLIQVDHYAQEVKNVSVANVMAVYIFNFTKFLEWPEDDSKNFYIYVYGNANILDPLNKIAEKENIKGKRIIVKNISDLDSLKKNSLLFISSSDSEIIDSVVYQSGIKNILTVSNIKGILEKGICINFLMEGNKMRFEVNRDAIENANIQPSTRLLSLAINK